MSWNLNSERPIYAQIMERITMDIISGIYAPGAKLLPCGIWHRRQA